MKVKVFYDLINEIQYFMFASLIIERLLNKDNICDILAQLDARNVFIMIYKNIKFINDPDFELHFNG